MFSQLLVVELPTNATIKAPSRQQHKHLPRLSSSFQGCRATPCFAPKELHPSSAAALKQPQSTTSAASSSQTKKRIVLHDAVCPPMERGARLMSWRSFFLEESD
uniref:Uncharacterized protein n=1 Tax=Mycena chlorophos TaxID=658473 RepID=A0ABQ0LLG1_MYCCL|nr:predicted protein [Mycena chlorophos]